MPIAIKENHSNMLQMSFSPRTGYESLFKSPQPPAESSDVMRLTQDDLTRKIASQGSKLRKDQSNIAVMDSIQGPDSITVQKKQIVER